MFPSSLKWPKHEIMDAEFFTQSKPTGVVDLKSTLKLNNYFGFGFAILFLAYEPCTLTITVEPTKAKIKNNCC
jgi:hypothetical protein